MLVALVLALAGGIIAAVQRNPVLALVAFAIAALAVGA